MVLSNAYNLTDMTLTGLICILNYAKLVFDDAIKEMNFNLTSSGEIVHITVCIELFLV